MTLKLNKRTNKVSCISFTYCRGFTHIQTHTHTPTPTHTHTHTHTLALSLCPSCSLTHQAMNIWAIFVHCLPQIFNVEICVLFSQHGTRHLDQHDSVTLVKSVQAILFEAQQSVSHLHLSLSHEQPAPYYNRYRYTRTAWVVSTAVLYGTLNWWFRIHLYRVV